MAGTGDVTLKQLTLRGGRLGASMPFRQGAGLFNAGGIVTIIDSTFTGNATGGPGLATSGGALYNADGVVTLIKSILSGNSATNGGGIWNTAGGSVTIRHSTIANNLGSAIAGGIFNEGTVTIIRSSLSSNQTFDPGIGGGIENFGAGTLTIVNSTISGNSGRRSGGIANLGGTVMVTNSTISDNSGQSAGGIDSFVGFGVVALQNTILALNSSIRAPDCSAVTSLGNNLIGTTTNCDITLQPSDLTGDPGLDTFTD